MTKISNWAKLSSRFILLLNFFCYSSNAFDQVVKNCTSNLDSEKPGLCISFERKLQNCPPLNALLRTKQFSKLRRTFCDGPSSPEEINWVKVCCPVDEYIEDAEPDYTEHPNFNLIPTPDNSNCGQVGLSSRIIGGMDVQPWGLPWMARIGMKLEDDDIVDFTCGGSIISSRYVLTAAHCFKDKTTKLELVRVSETDADEDIDCGEIDGIRFCSETEDHDPEELIIHPGYDGNAGSQNDIALIRLTEEIKNLSSLFTRPVCLPFAKQFHLPPIPASSSGIPKTFVSGWGKLRNSDTEGSRILQVLNVPVKDNVDCGKAFISNNITISERQICAGGEKDKGSCAGDSGSPLTYFTSPSHKFIIARNYQIGIVSFGKSQCAAGNAPVVYTRVRKYLSWILDNMKP